MSNWPLAPKDLPEINENMLIMFEQSFPNILPPKYHFTTFLIFNVHQKYHHDVLNEIYNSITRIAIQNLSTQLSEM